MHDRAREKLGVTDETHTRFSSLHGRAPRFASASITIRARDESNALHAIWSRDRRRDTDPNRTKEDRLCADPLVKSTGVSERLLRGDDPHRWAHAGQPERVTAQAIRILGPRLAAFDS